MATLICRPFITLRNGKILYASAVGKRAFCFEVDEKRPKKQKTHLLTKEDESEA